MGTQFKTQVRRGFTLIEILIVVVILGILAAIVIPQFTDAADDANDASVRSQLQTVRSQVELYNVQNAATKYDSSTTLGTFWDALVQGDYILAAPKNPLSPAATSTAVGASAGTTVGWVWRDKDGTGPATSYQLYAVDAAGAELVE